MRSSKPIKPVNYHENYHHTAWLASSPRPPLALGALLAAATLTVKAGNGEDTWAVGSGAVSTSMNNNK